MSQLLQEIEALRQPMKELNDFIFDHPELGNEEFQAQELLTNLLRQWNQFSTFGMLDTDSLLEDLEAGVYIRDYNLRMGIYGLEGVTIRGFRGQVIMQFKRNIELQRVLVLLSYYSQFTGLGIKTALGMGGVKCEVIE